MDENGGTPNPLNPVPSEGKKVSEPKLEPEDDIKFAEVPETPAEPAQPASFAQTITVEEKESVAEPELDPTPEPEAAEPEVTEPVAPEPESKAPVVDPMMRPKKSNFDTLSMDDGANNEVIEEEAVEEVSVTPTISNTPVDNSPELVAKDSIVEPVGGNKKKAFIIGAIVFLMIGIICGAAAIAIVMLGNNDDRVTKAIDKLLNGEVSNIISVNGTITSGPVAAEPSSVIEFDGTFDLKSPINEVSATVEVNPAQDNNFSFGINELTTKSGDVFFKVSGLKDVIDNLSLDSDYYFNAADDNNDATTLKTVEVLDSENGEAEEDVTTITTNCAGENSNLTNCQEQVSTISSFGNMLMMYAGLFEAADDEWVLASGDFAENMGGLNIFNNDSTCLISAFGTIPKYSKDIANKYKANPFITYSTNNLEITKKNNPLYRLSFDEKKLTAFINSLSNNGFVNELNACAGYTATNADVSTERIESFFESFPAIYVEIDNNYNFTRIYLKTDMGINGEVADTDADLMLSYPNELKVEQPTEYIEMSTLLNNVMKNLFNASS